ncbi:MAG: ABC transporter ATP-binding protein, partial [Deinococcota bacterium]
LVQARILHLLINLKEKENLTYVFITHDLSVVRNIANRVAVFEKGKLVELAETQSLFASPQEAYTRKLLSAIPVIDKEEARLRDTYAERI